MTIFGNGSLLFNTTTGHNATSLDAAMNYTYGTLLLVAIPIALTLNPVVFYYNRKQKLTLATGLFQSLAFLDFIYTFRSVMTAYNLLKPQHDALLILRPSVWGKLQGMFAYSVGYTSMFTTMVLCVVRYVKIRAPFWALGKRTTITVVTVTVLSADFTYIVAVSLYAFFGSYHCGRHDCSYAWFSPIQGVVSLADDSAKLDLYFFFLIPFYIKIGLSVIFSFLTVLHLRSEKGQQLPEVKRRSIIMIVLLNLGNVVWFLLCIIVNIITEFSDFSMFLEFDQYWFFYLTFLHSVLMQCLLAAYNPLVFCLRNTGLREMLYTFRRTGRMEVRETLWSPTPSLPLPQASYCSTEKMLNLATEKIAWNPYYGAIN